MKEAQPFDFPDEYPPDTPSVDLSEDLSDDLLGYFDDDCAPLEQNVMCIEDHVAESESSENPK